MKRFFSQFALWCALGALPFMAARWTPAQQDNQDQNKQDQNDQKDQKGGADQKSQQNQDSQQKGQSKDQSTDQSKDQSGDSSSSSSSSSSSAVPGLTDELKQQETNPNYNPLPAEQDVEVGTFYMHKGDLDAAIPRFEDAIRLRSNYAKPRILLAEIYEKKKDKANAVKYYKDYLQVYPHAPDAAKVQKKIEKLTGQ